MIFVVYLMLFIAIFSLLYFVTKEKSNVSIKKSLKIELENLKMYSTIDSYVKLALKKQLASRYSRFLSPIIVLSISIVIFVIAVILFNCLFKVFSTAIILAVPCGLLPLIAIKLMLNKEKTQILKALPMYVINLKNHLATTNNIIKAIELTKVEMPLKQYIDEFKNNISRGIDVIEAFDILKKDVDIKEFSELINACQVCYSNGGDFLQILDFYLNMITNENTHKEKTKEKAYSGILTLIAMLVLNVFVIFGFVLANEDYSGIVRNTLVGRLILDFNAVSYIVIAIIVSKLYREE